MTPFVDDADFTLYVGDVRAVLAELPDGSVDCCVTSPPYWGLRDYGTGTWEGGDPDHAHISNGGRNTDRNTPPGGGTQAHVAGAPNRGGVNTNLCDCGAVRVDAQIGLEATPDDYVAAIVEVFREVRRVLADHGTLWLNLGDSYNTYAENRGDTGSGLEGRRQHLVNRPVVPSGKGLTTEALKQKDLVGIPWLVAFALRADGWYLRSDIVWAKPNPMPESVTDRPTKSHEYVFLLSKSARYFYDAAAIAEPAAWERWGDQSVGPGSNPNGWIKPKTKNELTGDRRKVGFNGRWDESERVQTKRALKLAEQHGLTEAHLDAIRAVGITDTGKARSTQNGTGKSSAENQRLADEAKSVLGGYYREFLVPLRRNARSVWQIPTQPYPDAHFAVFPEALPERCILAGCPENGTVLDPFMGSGTTALVARRLGRKSVGIELNPEYAALAAKRLQQLSLFA